MTIIFLEKSSGRRIERRFDSYYLGMKFLNKVQHSKKLQLIAYWRWQ